MELAVKVTTSQDPNFNGKLHFKTKKKKITVDYSFPEGYPKKSLENGDEIDLTFQVGDTVMPVKGRYPKIFSLVSERVQCIWALTADMIYGNIFAILAGTEGEDTDIKSISREISGEVNDYSIELLFGEQ